MPAEQKQPFLVYLKNSRTTSANRLFFSYSISQESPFQNDELFLYLTDAMHCLQFHIPSLSQRREDIPALVGLYINSTNIQYGTRVIGLDKAALLTLQNYVWERNVDQLVQTVQELVLHAKASYISNDDVQALLACRPVTLSNSADYQIDLNRSLDDIIQDVVQRVYKMEDMNQTRTAEHLGISRSTVWRILKN